jgi:nicotinate-nucleotide adenylyltransferase
MPSAPTRLGVLGGTFDPPHIGHVIAAVEVRRALSLDRVLLMVANDPWQKIGSRPISPAIDRLAMVAAAVSGVEGLEAGDLEIVRGGTTYTVDTLEELHAVDPDAEIFLIVGADTAAGLASWERHAELPGLCTLVIVDRDGSEPVVAPEDWTEITVSMPRVDVSSTGLRDRLANGEPVDDFVPPGVVDVIHDRRLYGLAAS